MSNYKRVSASTRKLTVASVLTAIVFILQIMAIVTRTFLPVFSINLVLIPIVIGAAIGGVGVGVWLGFVSGVAVLVSGDAAAFLAINEIGTIITVLAKGLLSGLMAAIVYRMLEGVGKFVATVAAAMVCPLVNTGVFIAGCYMFFIDTLKEWGAGAGFENSFAFIILGMVGVNFLIELAVNIILSPTVVKLIDIKNK